MCFGGIGPIVISRFVTVSSTLSADERGLGTGALQDGVYRHRRPMEEQPGGGVGGTGLRDGGGDALDKMVRCRQRLAELELAGRGIERRHIREGAADVGGKAQVGPSRRGPRSVWRLHRMG